jgi:heptosyltransferase-3
MTTLIHHDGALGDVLLSLPCIQAIARSSGPVHLVGRGDVVRYLKQAGVVNAASASDQALFVSLYSSPDPRLRDFLSRFDRAFWFTAQEGTAGKTVKSIISDMRTIRTTPPAGRAMHAAEYRLLQLEPGIAVDARDTGLDIDQRDRDAAETVLRNAGYRPGTLLIGLHPGSGGRAKCWPLERFFEVTGRLEERGDVFVLLFTGESEGGEIREAVSQYTLGRRSMLHAGDIELLSAAALLRHCSIYLGNDSGFSHLAGLLGCTSIVLFGPTDPLVWKPLGPRVQVVAHNGPMVKIGVDTVVTAVNRSIRACLKLP